MSHLIYIYTKRYSCKLQTEKRELYFRFNHTTSSILPIKLFFTFFFSSFSLWGLWPAFSKASFHFVSQYASFFFPPFFHWSYHTPEWIYFGTPVSLFFCSQSYSFFKLNHVASYAHSFLLLMDIALWCKASPHVNGTFVLLPAYVIKTQYSSVGLWQVSGFMVPCGNYAYINRTWSTIQIKYIPVLVL